MFSVQVRHDYCGSAQTLPVRYAPSMETASAMRNADLTFSKTPEGFSLACNAERLDTLKALATPDTAGDNSPGAFHFKAYVTDACFANYTRVGGYRKKEILHFFVRNKKKDVLTAQNKVSEKDYQQIDTPVISKVLEREDRAIPPSFILSLPMLTNLNDSEEAILKRVPPCYAVEFEAREVFWLYTLSGASPTTKLAITDMENKVTFSAITSLDATDNPTFISNKAMPLQERPAQRFQLLEDNRVIMKRLPVASPKHIHRLDVKGHQAWVADIQIVR